MFSSTVSVKVLAGNSTLEVSSQNGQVSSVSAANSGWSMANTGSISGSASSPTQFGWVCPLCNTVLAPTVLSCPDKHLGVNVDPRVLPVLPYKVYVGDFPWGDGTSVTGQPSDFSGSERAFQGWGHTGPCEPNCTCSQRSFVSDLPTIISISERTFQGWGHTGLCQPDCTCSLSSSS